jgi:hypothetical protein
VNLDERSSPMKGYCAPLFALALVGALASVRWRANFCRAVSILSSRQGTGFQVPRWCVQW